MIDGLYIQRIPGRTTLARVSGGQILYLAQDFDHRRSHLGDVYMARVSRVDPGLNAAFVDLGGGQDAFLSGQDARDPSGSPGGKPAIRELVQEGQYLMVQVTKDSLGGKSARVSRAISLSGRHVVLTPGNPTLRLAKAIRGGGLRASLEAALEPLVAETGHGAVVRGLAGDLSPEQLQDAYVRLLEAWAETEEAAAAAKTPTLLIDGGGALVGQILDAEPGMRVIYDGWGDDDFDIAALLDRMAPDLVSGLELNRAGTDLFEDEGLMEAFQIALQPEITLPGGGRLIIETTQAATMIDIDTAGNDNRGLKADALARLNAEALEPITWAILSRGLSGLILIDFLKVKSRDQQKKVADRLRRLLTKAGLDAHVLGFTASGLCEVVITRTRASLDDELREADPDHPGHRRARGDVAAFDLIAALWRDARHHRGRQPAVTIAPALDKALSGPAASALNALEARLGLGVERMVASDKQPDGWQLNWKKPGS